MFKMSKKFNGKRYSITGLVFAAGFFFLPVVALAATTVYFDVENPTVFKGDIFLVNLKISTLDKPINVVDGTILYDNNKLEIKEVITGNSLFALWPKPPTFSNDRGTLSFVGGVPDGFQNKKGEVLKIIFLAKSKGKAQIDFLDGFSVFLNDGQGTQINPWLRPLSLNISEKPAETPAKDEWQALVEKDKTPPDSFEAIINRDPYLFDNQYFVSFFATDKDLGISYYEVKEGDNNFVRAESPYLLKDQSLQGLIKVKAVDKAGNERIEELMPPVPTVSFYKSILFWIAVFIIIIIVIFYVYRKNFRRKIKI